MSTEIITEKFFTAKKLFWCVVYDLMLVGLAATWIFVNVNVLGNDMRIDTSPVRYERD